MQRFEPSLALDLTGLPGEVPATDLLAAKRYAGRGFLRANSYDVRRASGETLRASLVKWIASYVGASSAVTPAQSRSRAYFEATLALLKRHGVTPCIVIMPYHPQALAALANAGRRPRLAAFKASLRGLQATYRFHLLDYASVDAFEGRTRYFCDGAQPTMENSRIILRHALKDAPESFR